MNNGKDRDFPAKAAPVPSNHSAIPFCTQQPEWLSLLLHTLTDRLVLHQNSRSFSTFRETCRSIFLYLKEYLEQLNQNGQAFRSVYSAMGVVPLNAMAILSDNDRSLWIPTISQMPYQYFPILCRSSFVQVIQSRRKLYYLIEVLMQHQAEPLGCDPGKTYMHIKAATLPEPNIDQQAAAFWYSLKWMVETAGPIFKKNHSVR